MPYLKNAVRYFDPLIQDLAETFRGKPLAPLDMFLDMIGATHLLGRQGVSMIATAGLDMAMWDAGAKAVGIPLASHLYPEVSAHLLRPSDCPGSTRQWH